MRLTTERCRRETATARPALLLSLLAFGCWLVVAHPAHGADSHPGPRVTQMEIDLHLDTERGLIEEEISLTVAGQGLSLLTFSIHESLTVERSRVSTGVIDHQEAGQKLSVHLDPPLNGSRRITFTVTGRPKGRGGSRVGPHWAVLDPSDYWYPRLPFTWAETLVRIHAPEKWVAVAPGRPVREGADGVWEWRSSKPVRAVAVAAAASLELDRSVAVRTPILVASPEGSHEAKTLSEILSDPLAWFSGALAPYPFDSFNLVFIEGFRGRARAGGMMVVPPDTPVERASDGADLLAGQWFGEYLAGDGGWMEAFAAWEATVYSRDRALPLPAEIARLRSAYFSLPSGKDVALSRAGHDSRAEILRGKGSAAPDMIRLVVDNRSFFKAVTGLFDIMIGPPMSLQDVRMAFERHTGKTLAQPFSEWFDRTGAPQFEAKLSTFPASRGGWRADLELIQTRDLYSLPVEVVFLGPGQSHREVIEVDEESTSVFYTLPFRPVRVEVDPSDRIFQWRRDE